jgi:flagellar motor switch protein FliN/FliY
VADTTGQVNMTNAEWLASEWSIRFTDIMQTMAETKPEIQVAGIEELPKTDLLWWKQPFGCSARGFLVVGAQEQAWSAVGQSILNAAGLNAPPPADIRNAWFELLRNSMLGLAAGISGRISADVTCGDGVETGIEHSDGRVFKVEAETAGSPCLSFYIVVSDDLANSLSVPVQGKAAVENKKSLVPGSYEHPANVAGSRTFDLLLDVELPVSVSFGRATLRIGDAMNLVSGSLIELDRALTDPVELLVNNCVIARGEVVVVDGNYGVRLTEIVSQKERLQQGRRHMLR